MRRAWAATLILALLPCFGLGADEGGILGRVPETPDPGARYLFYLHGRIIEVQGPEAVSPHFGRYEYQGILETFAHRGFQVIAEVREDGAGREFVEATARQVRRLLGAGVPGERITVVGFSKGGLLTLGVSAAVASDEVGYAVLAGCNADPRWVEDLGPRLRGRFLSLRDRSDRFSASCTSLFARADAVSETSEHVFETGLDHGLFYRPRADWVERVAAFAVPEGE